MGTALMGTALKAKKKITQGQWQAWEAAHRPEQACGYCSTRAGIYNHQRCFDCAVRLIVSARPNRAAQEAMLAITQDQHGRERLISAVKAVPKG